MIAWIRPRLTAFTSNDLTIIIFRHYGSCAYAAQWSVIAITRADLKRFPLSNLVMPGRKAASSCRCRALSLRYPYEEKRLLVMVMCYGGQVAGNGGKLTKGSCASKAVKHLGHERRTMETPRGSAEPVGSAKKATPSEAKPGWLGAAVPQ